MMSMFNFLKKSKQSKQPVGQGYKKYLHYKNMIGPNYKVISFPDMLNRTPAMNETQNEDFYLNQFRRGRMLDLVRNQVRNSATFNSILKQFDLHAVGTNGGKAIIDFDDLKLSQKVKDLFCAWTRNADFFDGIDFNQVLRLILKSYIIGGDCVLLFDSNLIEDSGKILIYESDEIGNIPENVLKSKYGKFANQSLGRVYNGNGRFIGVCVSRSQRGLPEFDPDKSYLLKKDPDSSYFDSLWLMPRNIFRPDQGRGVSPVASVLSEIIDLEDLLNFELQAAKKNAQVVGTVTQDREEDATLPSTFDSDVDFDAMTDSEIKAYAQEEAETERTMSLDVIKDAGAKYQVLPSGYHFDLLDTKRPNPQMAEFIRFIAGRTASPFGLSQHFADSQVTGSDYQANMLYSKRAFQDTQKFLERIADWCFYNFIKYSIRKGTLEDNEIFEDKNFMQKISWSWPKLEELDQNTYEQANALKLKNMTGSYKEILGNDWREKIQQIKEEIHWCEENKLPHPCFSLISGGERSEVQEILKEPDK